MKRLLVVACLVAGGSFVRAEDPTEPPPPPKFQPDQDAPERLPVTKVQPASEKTANPKGATRPSRVIVTAADTPLEKNPNPKVDSQPPLPDPKELAVPAPVPMGMPLDELAPHIPGHGPLYVDLQTMRPPGRGLAAILLAGPDVPPTVWGDAGLLRYRVNPDNAFTFDGVFRGYYRNDQRIEWSGVESTFGADGVLRPAFVSRTGDWLVAAEGEFFLNKRFGTSILSDPERDVYRPNFDVDTFEIFELFVEATYEDMSVRIGQSRTPFGRYQSPMFSNTMKDAQFLRTDVIGFIETGMFFRYRPDPVIFDFAIVNGEPGLDTNSSKGVVSRLGIEESCWTVGISGKYQDGVGSEFHKRYNSLLGIDGSVALGQFLIYSEAVYDQHGFHQDPTLNPNYDPKKLGVRSLYGRDAFKAEDTAIGGRGAYLGVTYRAESWLVDLSCGRYKPDQIGAPEHDAPINRFLFKTVYNPAHNLQLFLEILAENRRINDGLLSKMNPYAVYFGAQYGF